MHLSTPNPKRLKEIRCKAQECEKRNGKAREVKMRLPFPRGVLPEVGELFIIISYQTSVYLSVFLHV